jgi:CRP-like cAMP-binding protein
MDYSQLVEAPLFRGLNVIDIERILSIIPYRIRKFKAESVIAQSGEPVTSLMLVVSGIVKGEMVDYSGRVIKIEDIPAPGALAAAFIFGKRNRFPVNVISVTDGELMVIDKIDFLRLLISDSHILSNFLDMISNRSQFLSEKIKFLNFKTIKGKLAYYILQRSSKDSNKVNLGMTQADLAEFFGVTRPSIARTLGDLEDEGHIIARGKNIEILNRKALSDMTYDI